MLSIAKKVLGLFSRKKNIPPKESNSIGEKAKVDDSTNEVIIIFRTKDTYGKNFGDVRSDDYSTTDNSSFLDIVHHDIRPLLKIVNEEYCSEDRLAINLREKIEKPDTGEYVSSPDYYPSYQYFSPQQRYLFFEFLADPFCEKRQEKHDIGYVFCLFYMLEKHLEDFTCETEAFKIILELRKVYDNKSFQRYSIIALVGYCIDSGRDDLIKEIAQSTNEVYELPLNMFLYYCSKCGRMFTFEDLWRYRSSFDVSQRISSPKRVEEYISVLREKMIDYFGADFIDATVLVNDAQDFPKESIGIYTGINFNRIIEIPDCTQIPIFSLGCKLCFSKTIERFKKEKWSKENTKTNTYNHHMHEFCEDEEVFYRVLCEAIDCYTDVDFRDLFIRVLSDGTMVYSHGKEMGRIKLIGKQSKILVYQGNEKVWYVIDSVYDAIPYIPMWIERINNTQNN